MDKSTFNFLQKVVYDYKDTLRLIEEIENDIVYGIPETEDVQAGRTSVRTNVDVTSKKATALIENERLQMLRKQARAVEYARENIIEVKRDFIDFVYWERSRDSIIQLAIEYGISERTAYRWRREFLTIVGQRLGFLAQNWQE